MGLICPLWWPLNSSAQLTEQVVKTKSVNLCFSGSVVQWQGSGPEPAVFPGVPGSSGTLSADGSLCATEPSTGHHASRNRPTVKVTFFLILVSRCLHNCPCQTYQIIYLSVTQARVGDWRPGNLPSRPFEACRTRPHSSFSAVLCIYLPSSTGLQFRSFNWVIQSCPGIRT